MKTYCTFEMHHKHKSRRETNFSPFLFLLFSLKKFDFSLRFTHKHDQETIDHLIISAINTKSSVICCPKIYVCFYSISVLFSYTLEKKKINFISLILTYTPEKTIHFPLIRKFIKYKRSFLPVPFWNIFIIITFSLQFTFVFSLSPLSSHITTQRTINTINIRLF